MSGQMTAEWEVPLSDRIHLVQFDHGTTSGRRALYVDGVCIRREDFKFKLVGVECFKIGKICCEIRITAADDFNYEYQLTVDGKSLTTFTANLARVLQCWLPVIEGVVMRVALEKDSLDVYVNGRAVETAGEFTDEGSETHFSIGSHACYIQAMSSGSRSSGILHSLFVDNLEVPEAPIDAC